MPSGSPFLEGLGPRRKKIMPARGPRRDLCVVVVTMSQYSKGCVCSSAAMRPEMWAMSIMSMAPHLSAISRNLAYSQSRGYAEPPQMIILGLKSMAFSSSLAKSM